MRRAPGHAPQPAFRNPTVIGALTVLIMILAVFLAYNANSGLPFVRPTGSPPRSRTPTALVPGNEVRIGGVRVGVVEAIEPVAHEDGTTNAGLDLKLDTVVEPLPDRLDRDHPLALGARPQVPGDQPRHLRRGLRRGRDDAAVARRSRSRSRSTRCSAPSTRRRATRSRNLVEFGNALAGRGPDLNEAIGAFEPLLPRLERVTRILATRAAASAVLPRARAVRRRGRAGRRGPGADVRRPRHHLRRFADVARPYLQETISKTPATLLTRRPDAADDPALPRQLARRCSRDLAAGRRAPSPSPPTRSRALSSPASRRCASRRCSTSSCRRPPPRCARFNDDPDVRTGIGRLTELSDSLGPPLRFIGPAQRSATTLTLLFRNLGQHLQPGQQARQLAARQPAQQPDRPQQRGQPASAPANGGGGTRPAQLPARQPLPEHRRPGPDVRVRGRQRALRHRPDR